MIDAIKDVCLYLVVAAVFTVATHWLGSNVLDRYLTEQLITVLIALLAINTTTSGVVMTKLKEISDARGGNFSLTIKELKSSVTEQLIFIILAVIILVLRGSGVVLASHPWADLILEVALVAVFVAALYTLFDTARSIFVILEFENHKKQ